jgi:hypothetical protein
MTAHNTIRAPRACTGYGVWAQRLALGEFAINSWSIRTGTGGMADSWPLT